MSNLVEMRKIVFIPAAFFLLVIFSGCKPKYYIAKDFKQLTRSHKTVAVLPVEMVFTGNKPKKVTEAQLDSLEEVESLSFQLSLFNNLLRYSTTKKGTVRIDFQNTDKTLTLLEEKGIKLRDAWTTDPVTLCSLLGVDAVIKTRIVKQRYMGDLASFGVQMANRFIGPMGNLIPLKEEVRGGKTNTIDAQCTLYNYGAGEVLWKDTQTDEADWNSPSKEIIEKITVRFAKDFPYRNKH